MNFVVYVIAIMPYETAAISVRISIRAKDMVVTCKKYENWP